MRWVRGAVLVVGVALFALGALWFLQGSDLVHIEPVLCAADCETVRGWHPWWQLAGVVGMGLGVAAVMATRRGRPGET